MTLLVLLAAVAVVTFIAPVQRNIKSNLRAIMPEWIAPIGGRESFFKMPTKSAASAMFSIPQREEHCDLYSVEVLNSYQMARLLLLLALLASRAMIYAQPTGNVLSRVYHLRFGAGTATAFLIDYEDRQYFVTARHVMESAGQTAKVELQGPLDKDWKSYSVTVLLGKNKCVDVAVLIPTDKKLSDAEPIPYPYNFAFGQEAYFLGFPYGLYTSFTGQGMGVALIKHAYVSARVSCAAVYPDGDKDEYFILLDGLNNPGFSGGPVVAPDMFSPFTNIRAQKLIAVISGFRQESIQLRVGGKAVENATIPENTGIIVATYFDKAVDLIKAYVEKQKKP